MPPDSHPTATPERLKNSDVGDVFTVEAASSESGNASSIHTIERTDSQNQSEIVFDCQRCGLRQPSVHRFSITPCIPSSGSCDDSAVVINDTARERTRTLVLDIPMPDLLHALFTSKSLYVWHTRYTSDVEVMLSTESGLKSVKLYPHDGDTSPPSFDDYFSDGDDPEPDPHDKVAATFVIYEDRDLVESAASNLIDLAGTSPHFSKGAV